MNIKTLSEREKRFINNFIGTCGSCPDYVNEYNWSIDCNGYGYTKLNRYYLFFKDYIKKNGYLPEKDD